MSGLNETNHRLNDPVDDRRDHILGPNEAPITLVEYGSYDCPHCRAANERIVQVRGEFGDRSALRVSASPDQRQRYCAARRRTGRIHRGCQKSSGMPMSR